MIKPLSIISHFALPGRVETLIPYGEGNVNDTFLATCRTGHSIRRFILQRLNPAVFPSPADILDNLRVLTKHVQGKSIGPEIGRWELPILIASLDGTDFHRDAEGACWRLLSFIEQSYCLDQLVNPSQAFQVGRALGVFHSLVQDLPIDQLHDTLPGFHITPGYLAAYHSLADKPRRPDASEATAFCARFIADRAGEVGVLEDAANRGELQSMPIHGDPKPANVLFDSVSHAAISLIDLDTFKPGLRHYDLGDALRACCNRAGEESLAGLQASFNLDFYTAFLDGYLPETAACISATDTHYLFDALRLITFELGLRFFSDHLAGDVYFKVRQPGHNLARACAQFALCQSIEGQESAIRSIGDKAFAALQCPV